MKRYKIKFVKWGNEYIGNIYLNDSSDYRLPGTSAVGKSIAEVLDKMKYRYSRMVN